MIDIYNTETMIAGLQLLPPKPVFLRNRYFPSDDTTIFATEDVLVDIKDEYQRKMAPCVIERKGGIMVGREGYKTDRIKPANVAPKRALTIDNIRKRQFGETLFSRRKPEEREAAILRQDLVELSDMIDQREEYMASKVLFENGYTMRHYADEYGGDKYEEFEVHFYEEDQNPSVYVPAAAWNAADDKWYQDMTAMVRSLKRRGVPVADVLIGSSVANELMKNDFLLKMLDNRRVEIGRIEPTELAASATSYGRIIVDGTALELLSYSLQYLDEDGKVKSFVPEESIAVTAPNTGKFLYGAVTQMEESDREFHTYMAKRVPHLVTDVENSIRSITEKSKPLAVPNIKNSTISAKVLF